MTHAKGDVPGRDEIVQWSELLALIAPHASRAKTGRPPFELETMLRIHFVKQRFGLSDLAIEEALFEAVMYREFVGLGSLERIPDRVSILRFRHLLEEHQLAERIMATVNTILDKLEQIKARILGKVEHSFRVIKRQYGYTKVKYRGVAKKTANLVTLFALSSLLMARRSLLQGLRG